MAAQAKWQILIPDLSEEDWEEACSLHLTASLAVNNKLIQFYMLHQSYLSLVRLHAMHRITTPGCTRCTHHRADFNHIMWLCPVIAGYWKRILAILSQIVSLPVPCTPQICLLGILDEEQWPKFTRILLRETLLLAHKAIAIKLNWAIPPSTRHWLQLVNQILPFEKTIFEHKDCPTKYNKVWDPWCLSTLSITTTWELRAYTVKGGFQIFISPLPTELHIHHTGLWGRVPFTHQYGDKVLWRGGASPTQNTPPCWGHVVWYGSGGGTHLSGTPPFLACQAACWDKGLLWIFRGDPHTIFFFGVRFASKSIPDP